MTWLAVLILALIEGLTEFLPISSTAHLVIGAKFLGLNIEQGFTKIFEVNIQFGAILAVVAVYYKRFFQSFEFYFKLMVGVLPAVILGLLFKDFIDKNLESLYLIVANIFLGGILLIFVDNFFPEKPQESLQSNQEQKQNHEKEISYLMSFKIGCFQCLAMLLPGLSRSASSILGGMSMGLSRKQSAEFSFFLAVPTMFLASAYNLLKSYKTIQPQEWQLLAVGNVLAFLVAILAINFFVNILTKYGFKFFGYYRIVFAFVVLLLLY